MGRRTKGVIRERKDYTGLLLELQGKPPSPSPLPPTSAPEQKAPYSLYRQRIMSDETVKYLYSRQKKELHDKSCPKARDISDDDLCYSKEYLSDISQCPLCEVKAYLRLGAKDLYNTPLYEKLFERMQFTPELLRRMYADKRMRTSASNNGLTICSKEDSWRLEFWEDSNKMRLMHNNYRSLSDGTRVFTPGYHIQVEQVTPQHALMLISRYTYEKHKAAMLRRKKKIQERRLAEQQLSVPLEEPSTGRTKVSGIQAKVLSILKKFAECLRNIFRR